MFTFMTEKLEPFSGQKINLYGYIRAGIIIIFYFNFRLAENVVFFLLGDSPASEFFICRRVGTPCSEVTDCSETSAHAIQMVANHTKEKIKQELQFICDIVSLCLRHQTSYFYYPAITTLNILYIFVVITYYQMFRLFTSAITKQDTGSQRE